MIQASDRVPRALNMDPLLPADNGSSRLFFVGRGGEQGGVAARSGEVGVARPLQGKASEIIRASGLWTSPGQALSAERLHANHRADLVTIHVKIADLYPLGNEVRRRLHARVQAERQPIARGVDRLTQFG